MIYWHNKALSDRVFYKEWFDTHILEIPDVHDLKEEGPMESLLLQKENIYGKF